MKFAPKPIRLDRLALLASLTATLFIAGACERPETDPAVDETAVQARADTLEAQKRLEEALAAEAAATEAAEKALAEREALLEAREEQLRREEALRTQQERMAARTAELEKRKQTLAVREKELENYEANLGFQEKELRDREAAVEKVLEDSVSEPTQEAALDDGDGDGDGVENDGWVPADDPEESAPNLVEASIEPGRLLEIEILETLTSRTSRVGDTFPARLVQDLRAEDGTLVVPAGAEVIGRITQATPIKSVGGQASLGVEFTHIVLSPTETIAISASFVEFGANKRKDKKKIAGAAIVGAILGRVLGGDTEAVIAGAAAGAAAGTVAVARTKGKDAEIPAGETVALQLEEVVTVTVEMKGPAGN